ncbi:MAG TPA: hypothetical protein VJH67_00600 [Candidatus Paceibacterota bacterium]
MDKTWTLEVGDLFSTVGIDKMGLVEMNSNTYDFDPKKPKDSWLYPVFLGFQELKKEGFKAETFATIGTGSGIDSIGVYELFHPKKIYQVDIHPNIPELAQKNAKSLIGDSTEVETYLGDLCQPLIDRGIKVDLVYANIPNVPSDGLVFDKKVAASQFLARDVEDCPEILQKWSLTLQYLFLKQAKQVLNPGGVIVNAVGARVPYEVLEQLYFANKYEVKELVSIYKIQSEPEDTLAGYSRDEKNGVEFDFYDHEKTWAFWQDKLENQKWSTPKLKEVLKPFRITATQALEAFEKEGKQAGHVCSIFKSTP